MDKVTRAELLMHKLRQLYHERDPDFYAYYELKSDKLSDSQKREITDMVLMGSK